MKKITLSLLSLIVTLGSPVKVCGLGIDLH